MRTTARSRLRYSVMGRMFAIASGGLKMAHVNKAGPVPYRNSLFGIHIRCCISE